MRASQIEQCAPQPGNIVNQEADSNA